MKKLTISKGDTVEVITGSERGTKGAVMAVDHQKRKIRVQGVRVQTHFDKKEGVLKAEGFIDYSNVKLVEKGKRDPKKAKAKSSARK